MVADTPVFCTVKAELANERPETVLMIVTLLVLGAASLPGAVGLESTTLNVRLLVTRPLLMIGTLMLLVAMPLVK